MYLSMYLTMFSAGPGIGLSLLLLLLLELERGLFATSLNQRVVAKKYVRLKNKKKIYFLIYKPQP